MMMVGWKSAIIFRFQKRFNCDLEKFTEFTHDSPVDSSWSYYNKLTPEFFAEKSLSCVLSTIRTIIIGNFSSSHFILFNSISWTCVEWFKIVGDLFSFALFSLLSLSWKMQMHSTQTKLKFLALSIDYNLSPSTKSWKATRENEKLFFLLIFAMFSHNDEVSIFYHLDAMREHCSPILGFVHP
jgi:hypothetical protein